MEKEVNGLGNMLAVNVEKVEGDGAGDMHLHNNSGSVSGTPFVEAEILFLRGFVQSVCVATSKEVKKLEVGKATSSKDNVGCNKALMAADLDKLLQCI